MFSGLVWTGEEGVKLGVVDGISNQDTVAKDLIGAETLIDFSQQEHLLDKIAGKLGTSFGRAIGSVVQGWSLR
jgi:protease-4